MPKPVTPLTRSAIANRIKDEMRTTQGPAVDFGSSSKKEAQPAPDISELGVSPSVKKLLTMKISNNLAEARELAELVSAGNFGHLGLGLIERTAKKLKDPLSEAIKTLANDEVGLADEVPCFSVFGIRVTRYTTFRDSFDKEVMKHALLRLGVQPRVINEAMGEATSRKAIQNLRISEPGDDNE